MTYTLIKEISVTNYIVNLNAVLIDGQAVGYVVGYKIGNGALQKSSMLSSFATASMVFDSMVEQYDKIC
jgi:hypothetical protein